MGGDIITCIKGEEYHTVYGQLPSCKESEFFERVLLTCILNKVMYYILMKRYV